MSEMVTWQTPGVARERARANRAPGDGFAVVGVRERLARARRFVAQHLEVFYLGLAALVTAAYLVPSVIIHVHPPDSPRALLVAGTAAATGALGALALRWRRRRPRLVVGAMAALAVVAIVVTGAPGATVIGLALAIHALAATWPPVPLWPAVPAAIGAVALALVAFLSLDILDLGGVLEEPLPADAVATSAWTGEPLSGYGRAELAGIESRVVEATLAALIQLTAVTTGLNARGRAQRQAALDAQEQARARAHEQEILLARGQERTGIAREVHDVVAHSISVMVALADGAAAVALRSPEQARTAMTEVSETGRAALADMRRVLSALEEPAPDPSEEAADLTAMVERFRTAGLPVTATGLDTELPGPAGLATRRIVGEALTNTLRHAPGTRRVTVRVVRTADVVEIEVLDDGPSGPAPAYTGGTGRGLLGIHERAAILGGSAQTGPRDGGGWAVRVVLPVDEPREPQHLEGQ